MSRQPASTTAGTPKPTDLKDYIRGTIKAFKQGAATYADPSVLMTGPIFNRVIDAWYRMVIGQEDIIDKSLAGDAALKADLHAAYIQAIRVLVRRAAPPLGLSEADVLRANRGRIPMWAWPTPHKLLPGTSTPVPAGLTPNRSGDVTFTVKGVDIVIKPDTFKTTLPTAAHTSTAVQWDSIRGAMTRTAPKTMTRVEPMAPPTLTIQTVIRRGLTAEALSGYGRGTTAEDVAGGAVTPRSLTLGFHEGNHGLDAIEFVTNNPMPTFTGAVGMTKAEWDAAVAKWNTDTTDYANRLEKFQSRHGDCVGITIDTFRQQQQAALPPRKRTRIVLQCGP